MNLKLIVVACGVALAGSAMADSGISVTGDVHQYTTDGGGITNTNSSGSQEVASANTYATSAAAGISIGGNFKQDVTVGDTTMFGAMNDSDQGAISNAGTRQAVAAVDGNVQVTNNLTQTVTVPGDIKNNGNTQKVASAAGAVTIMDLSQTVTTAHDDVGPFNTDTGTAGSITNSGYQQNVAVVDGTVSVNHSVTQKVTAENGVTNNAAASSYNIQNVATVTGTVHANSIDQKVDSDNIANSGSMQMVANMSSGQ